MTYLTRAAPCQTNWTAAFRF